NTVSSTPFLTKAKSKYYIYYHLKVTTRNNRARWEWYAYSFLSKLLCIFEKYTLDIHENTKFKFMLSRIISLTDLGDDSCFLWGARQTGKSTLLGIRFPDARYIDLLKSDEFERYNRRPSLLREELSLLQPDELVIID